MSLNAILQAPLKPFQTLMSEGVSKGQIANILKAIGLPVFGIAVFLMLWQFAANSIVTSLGNFPGPSEVVTQFDNLISEHKAERDKVEERYERQRVRNEKKLEANPDAEVRWREYKSRTTFLITVMWGFVVASIIAIPIGIVIGLSANAYSAINPIIQTLKPVSPLAWLPLVTMVVSSVYNHF